MSSIATSSYLNGERNYNRKSHTLSKEELNDLEGIYENTINELLSTYSKESFMFEEKPSDNELDLLDIELQKAIDMLSSSTNNLNENIYKDYKLNDERDIILENRFSDIENFLNKYQ